MKIWNEYLNKDSNIVGIDIDKSCNRCELLSNVDIIIGDCNSENTIKRVLDKNITFDCILDDGSHYYNDIIKSIDQYFKLLKNDGIYIIEDLATMERISKNNISDLRNYLKTNIENYNLYEYPETFVIKKYK